MKEDELNLFRAIQEDLIYLILLSKFNRPVRPLELAAILKVTPVIAFNRLKSLRKLNLVQPEKGESYSLTRQAIELLHCTPFSNRKPVLDFDQAYPLKRSFDSFVLRRALAQDPLHEV